MQIKILHKQGKSLRAIAGEVGCSVNTVRKYLKHEGKPGYKQRESRPGKLTPFEDYIRARIEAALPEWIPSPVLCRELRERGYTGSERRLRQFTAALRPQEKSDPVVRFETQPGKQMQMDWTTAFRGTTSESPRPSCVSDTGLRCASHKVQPANPA